MDEINQPYRRLLIGVIEMAVRDTMLQPAKPKSAPKLRLHARTAFDFLHSRTFETYMGLLNLEPAPWRQRLFNKMYCDSLVVGFNGVSKRNFRINQKLWQEKKFAIEDDDDDMEHL